MFSVAIKQILSAGFQFLQNMFLNNNFHFIQNNLDFQYKFVLHSLTLLSIA